MRREKWEERQRKRTESSARNTLRGFARRLNKNAEEEAKNRNCGVDFIDAGAVECANADTERCVELFAVSLFDGSKVGNGGESSMVRGGGKCGNDRGGRLPDDSP